MPRMTAKYQTALYTADLHQIIVWNRDDRDELYSALQRVGHFWDSVSKSWNYAEPEDADEPTRLIMVRLWSDIETIEEVADDLIELVKSSKLPWELVERSKSHQCRPPKQNEARIYLRFLPTFLTASKLA